MYAPIRNATSSQTSGCALEPPDVGATPTGAEHAAPPSGQALDEVLEREPARATYTHDGQEQPGVEQPLKSSLSNLQVHEVQHDGDELDRPSGRSRTAGTSLAEVRCS